MKRKIALSIVFAVFTVLCIILSVWFISMLQEAIQGYNLAKNGEFSSISEVNLQFQKMYSQQIVRFALALFVFCYVIVIQIVFVFIIWKKEFSYLTISIEEIKEEKRQKRNEKINKKIEKLEKRKEK